MFSAVYWHITFVVKKSDDRNGQFCANTLCLIGVCWLRSTSLGVKETIDHHKCHVVWNKNTGKHGTSPYWKELQKKKNWDTVREVEETVGELSFTGSGFAEKWQTVWVKFKIHTCLPSLYPFLGQKSLNRNLDKFFMYWNPSPHSPVQSLSVSTSHRNPIHPASPHSVTGDWASWACGASGAELVLRLICWESGQLRWGHDLDGSCGKGQGAGLWDVRWRNCCLYLCVPDSLYWRNDEALCRDGRGTV